MMPVGRLGTPNDVAALVSFLVKEESAFITGQSVSLSFNFWIYPTSCVIGNTRSQQMAVYSLIDAAGSKCQPTNNSKYGEHVT
jgi:hypothetical protein